MRLRVGEKAKQFDMPDTMGNNISIEAFKGKKLMLSFYRYSGCPLCNLRISEIIAHMPEFEMKGLNLVAVFQSSRESIMAHVGQQAAPFPIIADPEKRLYRLYNVETSLWGYILGGLNLAMFKKAFKRGFKIGKSEGSKTTIPADFIIDEEGSVIAAYYGKNIGDHMPIEMVLEAIK